MAEAVSLSRVSSVSAGLFCTDMRLLCRDTRNFFAKIGLFLQRDRALLQTHMAPLQRDSALLRTTPGSVSTQGHMEVISSLPFHSRSPQHTATHFNTLQHTATHYNTQQQTAMHYNALQYTACQHKVTWGSFLIVSLVHTGNTCSGSSLFIHVT